MEKQAVKNLVRTLNKKQTFEDQEILDRSVEKEDYILYSTTKNCVVLNRVGKDSGDPLECGGSKRY